MEKNTIQINENVYIECYKMEENEKNPCVIICPGGGYGYHSPREGEPVAQKFLTYGFNSIVLHYSVADMAKFPRPLIDMGQAIKFLKENPDILPNNGRIITIGFSAGANLVIEYNAKWKKIWSDNFTDLNEMYFKPFLTICGYPPVSFDDKNIEKINEDLADDVFYFQSAEHIMEIATSGKRQLCEGINYAVFGSQKPNKEIMDEYNLLLNSDFPNMSPMFIFTTLEDKIINNEDLMKLLIKFMEEKVPFDFHSFQWGEHGLSLGDGFTATRQSQIDLHYSKWFDLCISWIGRQN